MKALDFFCGAGGLTRGLLDAGIDVIAGIDADENCADTYSRNNTGVRFVHSDITLIQEDDIRSLLGNVPSDDLLIAGCAPCQPFSKQRRVERTNVANKERRKADAMLLGELARIVELIKPAHVLVSENDNRGFSRDAQSAEFADDD